MAATPEDMIWYSLINGKAAAITHLIKSLKIVADTPTMMQRILRVQFSEGSCLEGR